MVSSRVNHSEREARCSISPKSSEPVKAREGATAQPAAGATEQKPATRARTAEAALGRAGITCNKNSIPFDPASPFVTSGVRLGTPAATTRGFGPVEFQQVGTLILRVIDGLAQNGEEANSAVEKSVEAEVRSLTARFPIYA